MDDDMITRLRQAIGRLARQLNKSATDRDLTPSQASLLGVIARGGPVPLPELARTEGLNRSMLSRMIGRLDQAGYVRRSPDPGDLRSAVVAATKAGRAVQATIQADRADVVARGVRKLSPEQRQRLADAVPALEALLAELREGR